ncbi:hypothetical protein ALC62_07468 [Cyphomyrmex costatus]|uniref:Uncharacterized protein n=1 Tax=Cyphomyrmex costatus TaxID=456900 RepID=A0A195CM54_9HYME|nr:hypothetical protein ALC62_07468 [Cyphomyrmex costatus]
MSRILSPGYRLILCANKPFRPGVKLSVTPERSPTRSLCRRRRRLIPTTGPRGLRLPSPPSGTANLLKPSLSSSSSSSSRFRNIGNCMKHASHGVYQDVRNRPLRINKRGRERRAFRGTFNLRQDRGWVNDRLETTKRRLENDDDEGSLVPWYQLLREKTGEWTRREVIGTLRDRTIKTLNAARDDDVFVLETLILYGALKRNTEKDYYTIFYFKLFCDKLNFTYSSNI